MIAALILAPLLAASWDQLLLSARDLHRAGLPARAEVLLLDALELAQQFPAHDPRRAATLANLASVRQDLGRYADAEKLYLASIASLEESLGRGSPALAEPLNSLASLYFEWRRYDRAERYATRALAIAGAADTARLTGNLASIRQAQRRFPEAEALYRRALSLFGDSRTSEAAFVWNNLGLLHMQQERAGIAIEEVRRALSIWEETLGPRHPNVAQGLGNLAKLYADSGRAGDAIPLLRRALDIAEHTFGPGHRATAHLLVAYASTLRRLDRRSEADQAERRARAILAAAGGDAWLRHRTDIRALTPSR